MGLSKTIHTLTITAIVVFSTVFCGFESSAGEDGHDRGLSLMPGGSTTASQGLSGEKMIHTGLGPTPFYNHQGPGADFIKAGVTTRIYPMSNPQTEPFTLAVPKLPSNAIAIETFIVWGYLLNGTPPPTDNIVVNAVPVMGTLIGSGSPDLCWSKQGVAIYYYQGATSIINPSTSGSVTATIAQATDKALGSDPQAYGEGLSILVVYEDPVNQICNVDIYLGYTSTQSGSMVGIADASLNFTIPYLGGLCHFFVNGIDGQSSGDEFYINNYVAGGVVGGTFTNMNAWYGYLGPNANSNYYDHANDDISTMLTAPSTSMQFYTDITDPASQDCIGHSFAAVSFLVDYGLCDFYKPGYVDYCPNGMPDFDQKQNIWKFPSGQWSWCGPVALANCLWWFDSRFEPSPLDPRPFGSGPVNDNYPLVPNLPYFSPWDDHDEINVKGFIEALKPFCNTDVGGQPGTLLGDLDAGVHNWLAQVGLTGEYTTTQMIGPEYDEIRDSIISCQDVILLLGFYEVTTNPDELHWMGGHYVTVAGVCSDEDAICISDPYFDHNEGEPPLGVHASNVHNDASYVSGPHGTGTHDSYVLLPNLYPAVGPTPSPAAWMFAGYPNNWSDISVFEAANPISAPAQIFLYTGEPIVVMLDAALIICPVQGPGDVNQDGTIDINDVADLTDFIYSAGIPYPGAFGDPNGDCCIDTTDIVYLIEHLFMGGPPPVTRTCCEPRVAGDVNGNKITGEIADAVLLTRYLLGLVLTLPIPANADVNDDCYIDALDVKAMIDFIQGIGSAPLCGCDNPIPCPCRPGDANDDQDINVGDAVYLISHIFLLGPPPTPYPICSGDANCDCTVNVGDAVFLISYVFNNGPPPCNCGQWLDACGLPLRN